MFYLINLFTAIGLLKLSSDKRLENLSRGFALFIFVLLWILVIGGQYGVGTDYFSYLYFFSNGASAIQYYNNSGEIGFYWFLVSLFSIGITGQDVFFLFSLIWVLLFLLIVSRITTSKYYYLFFFLLVCFNGIYHNQMNALRQYTAMYLITYALVYFICEKKYFKPLFIIIIAQLFHQYTFIALLFIIVGLSLWKMIDNYRILFALIIICFLISFIDVNAIVLDLIAKTSIGAATYLTDEFRLLPMAKIVKYFLFVYYLVAVFLYGKMRLKLSNNEKKIFILGIMGECLTLLSINNFILTRINMYFNFISLFPIFLLFKYIKRKSAKVFLASLLLIIYILKVTILATKEYSYNSFLFN